MSDTPNGPQPTHQSTPRPRKKIIWSTAAVVGGLVLLGAAFATGSATGSSAIPGYQHQVAQMRRELTAEQLKLTDEQGQVQSAKGQVQNAQTAAQDATTRAQARASTQYRSKMAALMQQQKTLTRQERAVKAEQGQIQKSSISADGVYVVGSDIASGTYHTAGDGGSGNQCYYATLASTNTSDIIDNNNFDGPETVDVSGAHAFQISGPCTWVKVG
jgi:uncharacterized protein HemX